MPGYVGTVLDIHDNTASASTGHLYGGRTADIR